MGPEWDALKAEVTRATTVAQGAVTLINGLASQLQANKDDPAAIQALADQLRADNDALSQALTANTPSACRPAPTPASDQ